MPGMRVVLITHSVGEAASLSGISLCQGPALQAMGLIRKHACAGAPWAAS